MSERHTQGEMSYQDKRPQCGGFSLFAGDQFIGFVSDSDECTDWQANAERMVACWNACEGIDTAYLKSGSVSIINKLHDEAAKLVLAQRDELLAALKSLEYANDRRAEIVTSADYIKQMKTNGMSEALEDLDIARRAARAVIAKVEGGA